MTDRRSSGWVVRSRPTPWWVRVLTSRKTPRVLVLTAAAGVAWLFTRIDAADLWVAVPATLLLMLAYWISYAQGE